MENQLIFDTHAHYDDDAFAKDREELLGSLQGHGVGKVVNVSASVKSLEETKQLMERYPYVYGAFGIHPDDAGLVTPEVLEQIRKLCRCEKAVAVGEIGLDYYWHKEQAEHKRQQEVFCAQLELAREEGLPFMVHSREAAEDTLRIVREYVSGGMHGGIIHCFSYSRELAREYLNMGLFLGIGGVVTFKNARRLKEVVEYAPLEQLVLETDAPYLAPEPYRGQRNASPYLRYVAAEIAQIKKLSPDTVVRVTTKNAGRLLKITI